jgi:hypothetical protein
VEGSGATLARNSVPTSEFKLPLTVPLTTQNTGQGAAIVNTTVFYCTDEKGACLVRQMRVRAPFEIVEGGSTKLTVPLEITGSGDVKVRAAS